MIYSSIKAKKTLFYRTFKALHIFHCHNNVAMSTLIDLFMFLYVPLDKFLKMEILNCEVREEKAKKAK